LLVPRLDSGTSGVFVPSPRPRPRTRAPSRRHRPRAFLASSSRILPGAAAAAFHHLSPPAPFPLAPRALRPPLRSSLLFTRRSSHPLSRISPVYCRRSPPAAPPEARSVRLFARRSSFSSHFTRLRRRSLLALSIGFPPPLHSCLLRFLTAIALGNDSRHVLSIYIAPPASHRYNNVTAFFDISSY
jgi:hypothetical protein